MDILSYLLGKNSVGGGGEDVSKYLDTAPKEAGSSQWNWWQTKFALPDMANLVIELPPESAGALNQMFKECKWTYIPKISGVFNPNNYSISLSSTFQNCSNVKVIDLSGLEGVCYRLSSAFNGCSSLEKVDMRNLDIGSALYYSSMLNNVPTDCLFIVKDTAAKTFMNTNFSNYTNVKTPAELES